MTKLPEPFASMHSRARALKQQLFEHGISAGDLNHKLRSGRSGERQLFNYCYALLGPGTLLLRFSAVILLQAYRKFIFPENPNAALNQTILESLRDKLPTDTDWLRVLERSASAVAEDGDAAQRLSAFLKLLESKATPWGQKNPILLLEYFVRIRNKIAHFELARDPEKLLDWLQCLESVLEQLDVFSGTAFQEEAGHLTLVFQDGELLSLHPFCKAERSEESGIVIPYVFQGLYDNKTRLSYLGSMQGDEQDSDGQAIRESFLDIGRDALGVTGKAFDFSKRIERYLACFVGRDKELDELEQFCSASASEDPSYLAVTAEAGFGKSALLAALVNRLGKQNVLHHFCGSGELNNPLSILASLLHQGKTQWQNLPEELKQRHTRLPGSWDGLRDLFQQTLEAWQPGKKAKSPNLVILIDGVDQAMVSHAQIPLSQILIKKEKTEEGENESDWEIPENIRVIFGYRDGMFRDAYKSATLSPVQPLQALGEDSVGVAFQELGISREVHERIVISGRPHPPEENAGKIDPSYLRFVYDEMQGGRLSAANASAIPKGLTGLYERELEKIESYAGRERAISVFTGFAVAQGPLSIELLAAVLGGTQEYVEGLVAQKPAWFNSEGKGLLSFYHDRLRAFFLQRASEFEVTACNDRYLQLCENRIRALKVEEVPEFDESARYALAYLVEHLLAMVQRRTDQPPRSFLADKQAQRLYELAFDDAFQKLQVAEAGFYTNTLRQVEAILDQFIYDLVGGPWDTISNQSVIELNQLPAFISLSLQLKDIGHRALLDADAAPDLARKGDIDKALSAISSLHDERTLLRHIQLLLEVIFFSDVDIDQIKVMSRKILQSIETELGGGASDSSGYGSGFDTIFIKICSALINFDLDAEILHNFIDQTKKCYFYIKVADELYAIDKHKAAEAYNNALELIPDKNWNAISSLISSLSKLIPGEPEAIEMLERLLSPLSLLLESNLDESGSEKGIKCLMLAARALWNAGEKKQAQSLVERAHAQSNRILFEGMRSECLCAIAEAAGHMGLADTSDRLFKEALDLAGTAADGLPHEDLTREIRLKISARLAYLGQARKSQDEVTSIWDELHDSRYKFEILSKMLLQNPEIDRSEWIRLALEEADLISDTNDKAAALICISRISSGDLSDPEIAASFKDILEDAALNLNPGLVLEIADALFALDNKYLASQAFKKALSLPSSGKTRSVRELYLLVLWGLNSVDPQSVEVILHSLDLLRGSEPENVYEIVLKVCEIAPRFLEAPGYSRIETKLQQLISTIIDPNRNSDLQCTLSISYLKFGEAAKARDTILPVRDRYKQIQKERSKYRNKDKEPSEIQFFPYLRKAIEAGVLFDEYEKVIEQRLDELLGEGPLGSEDSFDDLCFAFQVFGSIGDRARCLRALKVLLEDWIDEDRLVMIAAGASVIADTNLLNEICQALLHLTRESLFGDYKKSVALRGIALALYKAGANDLARETLAEALRYAKAVENDEIYQVRSMLEIVQACSIEAGIEQAEEVLDEVVHIACDMTKDQDRALVEISEKLRCLSNPEFKWALEAICEFAEESDEPYSLVALVESCVAYEQQNENEDLRTTLRKAIHKVTLDGYQPACILSLIDLARMLSDQGKYRASCLILQEAAREMYSLSRDPRNGYSFQDFFKRLSASELEGKSAKTKVVIRSAIESIANWEIPYSEKRELLMEWQDGYSQKLSASIKDLPRANHESLRKTDSLISIIRSIGYMPIDNEIVKNGAYRLVEALLLDGEIKMARDIAAASPQLGLSHIVTLLNAG